MMKRDLLLAGLATLLTVNTMLLYKKERTIDLLRQAIALQNQLKGKNKQGFGSVSPEPVELTESERQKVILTPLPPMDIELRVVSTEQWLQETKAMPAGTDAFSAIYVHPCRITIPSGWLVMATPWQGSAHWVNRDNGSALAHELLHCARGSWHPPWPEIFASSQKTKEGPGKR